MQILLVDTAVPGLKGWIPPGRVGDDQLSGGGEEAFAHFQLAQDPLHLHRGGYKGCPRSHRDLLRQARGPKNPLEIGLGTPCKILGLLSQLSTL